MPRQKKPRQKCSIDGCEGQYLAQGRCSKHYHADTRRGVIQRKPQQILNAGPCPVEGCGKPKYGAGYCQPHYEKFRKYGDPLATAPKKTGGVCSTSDCSGVVVANGVCAACYARIKKRGSTAYSKKHLARYENVIDSNGYVQIPAASHPNAKKSKRMAEHRFVMSQFLGRPLFKNENVHHKNGDRQDNRLANLELWVSSQPSGQRPLDLLAWARSILKTYRHDEPKLKELDYRNL